MKRRLSRFGFSLFRAKCHVLLFFDVSCRISSSSWRISSSSSVTVNNVTWKKFHANVQHEPFPSVIDFGKSSLLNSQKRKSELGSSIHSLSLENIRMKWTLDAVCIVFARKLSDASQRDHLFNPCTPLDSVSFCLLYISTNCRRREILSPLAKYRA